MLRNTLPAAGLIASAILSIASPAHAVTAQWSQPDLDRWMYPFNFTPGTRSVASLFGAPDNPSFDDRDAQVLMGFNTSSLIPIALAPSEYQITKVTVTSTISGGSFLYDPTYDSFTTYQAGGVDNDAGRPIELYGVGFRGNYTQLDFGNTDTTTGPGFEEAEAFGSHNGNPGTFDQDRSALALGDIGGGVLGDISNNVKQTFDTNPFAVGTNASLLPGDDVPVDTTFTFDLDLSDPLVLAYLRAGLSEGQLAFALSSMHPADQFGPAVFPFIYLDEHLTGQPFTLDIEFTIGQSNGGGGNGNAIPEPTTLSMLVMSLALLARPRHRQLLY